MNKRKLTGEKHPLFRGGKTIDPMGYVVLCSKIWGINTGRREHRVVIECYLDRKLCPDEIVHHKNGNRSDNRLENLEVLSRADHNRTHHGRGQNVTCVQCGFTRWYSPSILAKLARKPKDYLCRKCMPHWTSSRNRPV